jgi:predicted RNase H-like HicB family nuclease
MTVAVETLVVVLKLSAFLQEEGGQWVAGCRSLDVYSQGDTPDEAKANLSEAVQLWIESCVERDTLGEALRELGWSAFRAEEGPVEGADLVLSGATVAARSPLASTASFPLEELLSRV